MLQICSTENTEKPKGHQEIKKIRKSLSSLCNFEDSVSKIEIPLDPLLERGTFNGRRKK